MFLLAFGGGEHRDTISATAVFVSEDPPLFTLNLAKHVVSHGLVGEVGKLMLTVASEGQANVAVKPGSTRETKSTRLRDPASRPCRSWGRQKVNTVWCSLAWEKPTYSGRSPAFRTVLL